MNRSDAPPPSLLGNRPPRRPLTIGLTPLIDVVFILIVFFMLASSFHQWRSVTLEAPSPGGAGSAFEGTMLIEVRPESVRLAGRTLSVEDLTTRVSERLAEKPDQRILIRPAGDARVQEIIRVVDAIAAAGARNVSLVQDAGR
tara:strand:- start:5768 stop:6196 length:429 start_codon:yes stop_codon:yes gene_type:complete